MTPVALDSPTVEPPVAPHPQAVRPVRRASNGWRVALVALVAAIAAGVGGYAFGARSDEARPSTVDAGFLRDMVTHHEQAVLLASGQISELTEPRLRAVAREIVYAQSREIGHMERRLSDWGIAPNGPGSSAMAWMGMAVPVEHMPGMASTRHLAARIVRQQTLEIAELERLVPRALTTGS